MGAIQPNKNFDNEHREHTPYQKTESTPVPIQQRYAELMKKTTPPTKDIRDGSVYAKYFNTK